MFSIEKNSTQKIVETFSKGNIKGLFIRWDATPFRRPPWYATIEHSRNGTSINKCIYADTLDALMIEVKDYTEKNFILESK